jgi:hypothetical protein
MTSAIAGGPIPRRLKPGRPEAIRRLVEPELKVKVKED